MLRVIPGPTNDPMPPLQSLPHGRGSVTHSKTRCIFPSLARNWRSAGQPTQVLVAPCVKLRLQRQRGFSGGTVVDQLDRADALGFTPKLEKNQSGLRKHAVSFG